MNNDQRIIEELAKLNREIERLKRVEVPKSVAKKIGCKVIRLSSQSIPTGTWTAINWTSEDWDTDSMHDNSTNNQRITIKTAGIYRISANINFEASTAVGNIRCFRIVKNAVAETIVRDNLYSMTSPGFLTTGKLDTLHNCAVNDYFMVEVWQNSGGGLDLVTAYPTEFMAELVS